MTDGNEIWVSESFTSGWAGFNYQIKIAYGLVYEIGYDGHVRAYDVSNGDLVWDFHFGSAGYELLMVSIPTIVALISQMEKSM